MYRLTSILLAGAVVFGIGAKSAYAQVGLGLAPMRAELKMAPGAVYSGALDLTNEATVKVRVRTEPRREVPRLVAPDVARRHPRDPFEFRHGLPPASRSDRV